MKKPILYLFIGFFFISQPLFSQKTDSLINEVDSIKKTIYALANDYMNLGKTRDVQSVLKYYTADYTADRASYKITGKLERDNGDVNSLRKVLLRLSVLENPIIRYDIKDLYKVGIAGGYGYAVYFADFTASNGDKLVARGSEIQMLLLRKENGKWKVAISDILNLVVEQEKGNCGCAIFSGSPNEYLTKVQRPNGRQYDEALDNFLFRQTPNGNWKVIVNGEDSYTWLTQKDLYFAYGDKQNQRLLGREMSQKGIVYLILKEDLYKNNCNVLRPNNLEDVQPKR